MRGFLRQGWSAGNLKWLVQASLGPRDASCLELFLSDVMTLRSLEATLTVTLVKVDDGADPAAL